MTLLGGGAEGEMGSDGLESQLLWRRDARLLAGVSIFYLADKLLALACSLLHVTFPSALIGLFIIVAALLLLSRAHRAAADAVMVFFRPAVDWVAHRWLALFYSPALVMLPLAVQPLSGVVLLKAVAVVAMGILLTLSFTGQLAVWIRRATGTEMLEVEWHHQPMTFSHWVYLFWGCAALSSLLAAAYFPVHLGRPMAFSFLLSTTVLGYLGGQALPPGLQRVMHPVLVCGAAPNVGAVLLGMATKKGYWETLRGYTKGSGGVYGPGDLLLSFLGVIILSFAFKIVQQWTILKRHAPEILGSTTMSAAFSMLSTAALCRLLALPTDVSLALVPRSITMALALPVAAQLGAPQPICAAGVVLTGIVGANFVQALLDALRFRDPIARGLAAAATAHGLGTAALAGKEPEALPYCALSYALCGISATLLASLPFVRALLQAIAG